LCRSPPRTTPNPRGNRGEAEARPRLRLSSLTTASAVRTLARVWTHRPHRSRRGAGEPSIGAPVHRPTARHCKATVPFDPPSVRFSLRVGEIVDLRCEVGSNKPGIAGRPDIRFACRPAVAGCLGRGGLTSGPLLTERPAAIGCWGQSAAAAAPAAIKAMLKRLGLGTTRALPLHGSCATGAQARLLRAERLQTRHTRELQADGAAQLLILDMAG